MTSTQLHTAAQAATTTTEMTFYFYKTLKTASFACGQVRRLSRFYDRQNLNRRGGGYMYFGCSLQRRFSLSYAQLHGSHSASHFIETLCYDRMCCIRPVICDKNKSSHHIATINSLLLYFNSTKKEKNSSSMLRFYFLLKQIKFVLKFYYIIYLY